MDGLNISIGNRAIRKMALLLLDDENGIDIQAYGYLSAMLVESGNDDILEAVDVTDKRAYVGEDFAFEQLATLDALDFEALSAALDTVDAIDLAAVDAIGKDTEETSDADESSETEEEAEEEGNCHTEFNTETCENEVVVDEGKTKTDETYEVHD